MTTELILIALSLCLVSFPLLQVPSGVVVMDEFLPNVYSPPKRTKVSLSGRCLG